VRRPWRPRGHDLRIQVISTNRTRMISQCFSIENFKRSEDEVAGLLDLARDKLARILDEADRLRDAGVRVRVVGRLSLMPVDLRQAAARAEEATAANGPRVLNVALAFTSREEIVRVIMALCRQIMEALMFLRRHMWPPRVSRRASLRQRTWITTS